MAISCIRYIGAARQSTAMVPDTTVSIEYIQPGWNVGKQTHWNHSKSTTQATFSYRIRPDHG